MYSTDIAASGTLFAAELRNMSAVPEVGKIAIVSAGLLLLCIHRSVVASQWAIRLGAGVYAIINVYHLAFVAHCITV